MMKKNSMLMVMGFLAATSFFSLIIAVHPALISDMDLSSQATANIGSTIGGITSPIVGMFSAYLIYDALSAQLQANEAQKESNRDQRVKSDSDIIFLLLAQLDKQYDSFTIKRKNGTKEDILHGFKALVEYCSIFSNHVGDESHYHTFATMADTTNLLYLLRSFDLIKDRIVDSKFEEKTEKLFHRQLELYYRTKFRFPITMLLEVFKEIDAPLINEIEIFNSRMR